MKTDDYSFYWGGKWKILLGTQSCPHLWIMQKNYVMHPIHISIHKLCGLY